MSWLPDDEPECPVAPAGVELVIVPRAHDLGGFEVRRALPAKERPMVGPFIFFDQMGPGEFLAGQGLDVRPHPHIGLATVTYLFEGSILHRDSLGSQQPILPGDVNWMTAGSGIAHSERTEPALRTHNNRLFGIQSWVALPKAMEEIPADFVHYDAKTLPVIDESGTRLRLIAGEGWGACSPVSTYWPLFYADASLAPGADLPLPEQHEERGAYVVQGSVEVAGTRFDAGRMLLFRAGDRIGLKAGSAAPGCWCWAAPLWTDRASYSGTSSLGRANGSSRQRPTGKRGVSRRSLVMSTSSSHYPKFGGESRIPRE